MTRFIRNDARLLGEEPGALNEARRMLACSFACLTSDPDADRAHPPHHPLILFCPNRRSWPASQSVSFAGAGL